MPKVHRVAKARKDQKGAGIKKGDTYYWWKFRYGGKHVSKTYPKPSQLTQSEYLSGLLSLEETGWSGDTREDAAQSFRDVAGEVQDLGEEQGNRRDNMPESLQDSETGELLQTRADRCEEITQALEEAADELDRWEPEAGEEAEAWRERADELWSEIDWTPE